jgi:dCMP deaminase
MRKTLEELDKWDKRFLELAIHISGWSKDPSTKVGAVIVAPDKRIISLGYNGFPRGVVDTEERLNDRETKYKFVAHAERNALDNTDQSIRGCTMYATLQPCPECAKSIIQRGVKKVVYRFNPERENLSQFLKYTLTMFHEASVEVIQGG